MRDSTQASQPRHSETPLSPATELPSENDDEAGRLRRALIKQESQIIGLSASENGLIQSLPEKTKEKRQVVISLRATLRDLAAKSFALIDSDEKRTAAQGEITRLREELETATQQLSTAQRDRAKAQKEIVTSRAERASAQQELETVRNEVQSLEAKLAAAVAHDHPAEQIQASPALLDPQNVVADQVETKQKLELEKVHRELRSMGVEFLAFARSSTRHLEMLRRQLGDLGEKPRV